MLEVAQKPNVVEKFWQYVGTNYRVHLYGNEEEKQGFKTILLQLANIDGEFDSREQQFVNEVLKACGLP